MATVKLNLADLDADGVSKNTYTLTECEVAEYPGGGVICTAPDGRFVTFPDEKNLAKYVAAHNKENQPR